MHVALGVGVHRADVELEAVLALRLGTVVTDRHWQEVEHQVRVVLVLVGTGEAAGLEVGGCYRAAAGQQPLEADERAVDHLVVRLGAHRLGAVVLHVDLEVVLQVVAHAGQVLLDLDASLFQHLAVTDAGQFQQLRGVEGAAAEDDLVGEDAVGLTLPLVLHAHGLAVFNDDLRGVGASAHVQVLAVHDRVQVGASSGEALAAQDVAVEGSEALLAVAVDVVGEVVASLLDGLEEGLEQRAGGRAAG